MNRGVGRPSLRSGCRRIGGRNESSILKMVDAIGLLGHVGVVRNYEDAGPLGQRSKMIDEVRGRFGIEVVARLIEDQKAGAFEKGSGECDPLPLASGEEYPALSHFGFVAVR